MACVSSCVQIHQFLGVRLQTAEVLRIEWSLSSVWRGPCYVVLIFIKENSCLHRYVLPAQRGCELLGIQSEDESWKPCSAPQPTLLNSTGSQSLTPTCYQCNPIQAKCNIFSYTHCRYVSTATAVQTSPALHTVDIWIFHLFLLFSLIGIFIFTVCLAHTGTRVLISYD